MNHPNPHLTTMCRTIVPALEARTAWGPAHLIVVSVLCLGVACHLTVCILGFAAALEHLNVTYPTALPPLKISHLCLPPAEDWLDKVVLVRTLHLRHARQYAVHQAHEIVAEPDCLPQYLEPPAKLSAQPAPKAATRRAKPSAKSEANLATMVAAKPGSYTLMFACITSCHMFLVPPLGEGRGSGIPSLWVCSPADVEIASHTGGYFPRGWGWGGGGNNRCSTCSAPATTGSSVDG